MAEVTQITGPPHATDALVEMERIKLERHKFESKRDTIGGSIIFLGCLAALILNSAIHIGLSKGADTALIIGVALGGMELLFG